ILGLIPKDTGSITFNGRKLKNVQKKIAYVPQRNMIDWDFPITVRDVVVMGTYQRLGIFHHPRRSEKQLAEQCLEQVGMKNYSIRHIGELCGGQQQHVFFARALAE